ncbi:MAG: hypothetical protein COT85_02470 [Chlamydiae bacterium CG10_big_fil_rev_8_21_14_0_10_42_34]|nr:MAG: hypothetical protein COT85_02470 [Chlamydiae bacterium CG10_big_fil_rev_8_21_14_0_10_42_34]
MKSNYVDLPEPNEILLGLVEALEPFIKDEIPNSFFLSKRFALNGSEINVSLQKRSVEELLIRLQTIQEQVTTWVGDEAGDRTKKGSLTLEPIVKQASLLLRQVRGAIGKLCTSKQIQEPAQEPIRQTLKSIQPELKKMVEAINGSVEDLSENEPIQSFRHPLPRSSRQELLQKLTSFHEVPRKPYQQDLKAFSSEQVIKRGGEGVILRDVLEEGDPFLKDNPISSLLESVPNPKVVSFEKTALPAAPFTPPLRNLPSTKKKKRRKKLFSRDEEDDENNNS